MILYMVYNHLFFPLHQSSDAFKKCIFQPWHEFKSIFKLQYIRMNKQLRKEKCQSFVGTS